MKSLEMAKDITASLRARNPIIWVVTREEARVESYLFEAAAAAKYLTQYWDAAAGFTDNSGNPLSPYDNAEGDPDAALNRIKDTTGQRVVWVLRDFPTWITGPTGPIVLRRLRNLARPDGLPSKASDDAQAIIVISPTSDVPPELSDVVTVLNWPLPDREEIADILDATIESLEEQFQAGAVNGSRDAVIDAAVGLSKEEAQATFARSLVDTKKVDPAVVTAEKKRVVAKTGGTEWFDPIPDGVKAVGGYDNMMSWFVSRASAYTQEARAYGLPTPKGALLVGVPGCGKSLACKAIGSEWKIPVIRIDLSALKGKYVGESEANLRNTFSMIEAIGRCVVWVDEIEKALAGSTDGSADGGVSADALGFLLSWMQERQGEAFVIATANNAERLPPELLRKGRFDEVWWVDLPNRNERASVIMAALRSNKRNAFEVVSNGNLGALLDATEQFTGAEIAALVPDAMFAAFNDGAREITADDLLMAAKTVVPLAKTASEKITRLREFWVGRARPATAAITEAPRKGAKARVLDLN